MICWPPSVCNTNEPWGRCAAVVSTCANEHFAAEAKLVIAMHASPGEKAIIGKYFKTQPCLCVGSVVSFCSVTAHEFLELGNLDNLDFLRCLEICVNEVLLRCKSTRSKIQWTISSSKWQKWHGYNSLGCVYQLGCQLLSNNIQRCLNPRGSLGSIPLLEHVRTSTTLTSITSSQTALELPLEPVWCRLLCLSRAAPTQTAFGATWCKGWITT